MRVAIIRFPGSNCDQDALYAAKDILGLDAGYVWYDEHSLSGYDAVFIPGGFSYGDYLRCGAMASRAAVIQEVARLAKNGHPVIGVCNGFQILCEAGLLPGALLANSGQKFLCQDVYLDAVNRSSIWTRGVEKTLRIPIAHGEGRYIVDDATLKRLQDDDSIAFRYVHGANLPDNNPNPNGAMDNIAGVLNREGNVLGMMPHPERACSRHLGSDDGLQILRALMLVGAA